jgi:hypothetical protein
MMLRKDAAHTDQNSFLGGNEGQDDESMVIIEDKQIKGPFMTS